MSVAELSAAALTAAARAGDLSALEIVEAFAKRVEALDPSIGAFLDPMIDQATERARALDRLPGESRGPLHGLPVAVKDIISVAGAPCTCGSRILEGYRPLYDATAVTKLHDAGAVVFGKTNLDEFAMGSSTENSSFKATRNPWDLTRVPGGSSGGSAAAVAARMVPAALGTDTGGSIRQPAAFCGVTGLKPTYGRVSRYGLVAFASSFDQIGPMARSAEDLGLLLESLAGEDPRDATTAVRPVSAYGTEASRGCAGLRLGVPRAAIAGADESVLARFDEAISTFAEIGVEVATVELPTPEDATACYYLLSTAEASANLARFDGVRYGHRSKSYEGLGEMYGRTRGEGFGAEVKRRILLGTFVLSAGYYDAYYQKAQRVRRLITRDFEAAFEGVDAIFLPTTPTPAFRLGEKASDPLAMYLSDIFTITANLTGAPALSLPIGLAAGLPVGGQLIGKHFDESTLLRLAVSYQGATAFHQLAPTLPRA